MRIELLTSKNLFHKFRYKLSAFGHAPQREHFLNILPKNAVGAEIGVFKGEFSPHLLDITKPRELHLVDLWWKIGEYFQWGGTKEDKGRLKTRDAFMSAKENVREADPEK